MLLISQVLILSILSRTVVTFLAYRQRPFTKIVAHFDTIPRFSDIISQHRNVSSLSQCGIKCSGEFECCSFFYSDTAQHCLTVGSVHEPALASSTGYNHYSLHGEVFTEGVCFNNSLYVIGNTREVWADAQVLCKEKDAKLVEIGSNEENEFLRMLHVSRSIEGSVWVGGTDISVEGAWIWIDKGDAVSFTAWGPNQPNNYNNQDCLSLYAPYQLWWADEPCSTTYNYICEKNPQ